MPGRPTVAAAAALPRPRRLAWLLPPMFSQPGFEHLATPVTLTDEHSFPAPVFTAARHDARKRAMPQCIAHRGYRAAYPENTLAAFAGAVRAGAHALETDVHLTKDDVVVLSHDADLTRCFGRPDRLVDCTWDELRDLRTLAKPHEPLPRLSDLLEYLAQPGLEDIWLLLDIKLDNDPDTVMRRLGDALTANDTAPTWRPRVVLGIWAAKYLPLAAKYLPGFPITHIGFSLSYARNFFAVPNVSFNVLFHALMGPGGTRFLRDARQTHHRPVYAWTVNAEDRMRWCIRHRLDGVITDDPRLFLEVCERFDERSRSSVFALDVRGYLEVYKIWVWLALASWMMRPRFTLGARKALIQREAKS